MCNTGAAKSIRKAINSMGGRSKRLTGAPLRGRPARCVTLVYSKWKEMSPAGIKRLLDHGQFVGVLLPVSALSFLAGCESLVPWGRVVSLDTLE